ncbi:MAG: MBOAT family O-acyltransferase [Eubacteriales bacterium]|nr:MBOAT family O-acyltransferase [Eubacteriales bacterium]
MFFNRIMEAARVQVCFPTVDVLLPVGISFYTFQAIGYTIDVYRGEIYAEKNFARYALFVSFFPQLVAGPIERSKNLLRQLAVPAKLKFENFREGLLLMLWGYFLKVVLADRIALFVDTIYGDNWTNYSGCYFAVATVLFAVQIYCDFSGYSVIAMGAAKMLGIDLMVNFDAPYLSASVSEFWRKWHISLSSWFRDYLYIPLGGNRRGRLRKYVNLMITFGVSGMWHGAAWTYMIWGLINGAYQVLGDLLKPLRRFAIRILGLNEQSLGHRIFRTAATFALISISWIFFRAESLHKALVILKSMFTVYNPWILIDGALYKCGLARKDFQLMLVCIGILLFADILKYKKIVIRDVIAKQDWWCQALIVSLSALAVMLVGIWGSAYDAASFIYFQF